MSNYISILHYRKYFASEIEDLIRKSGEKDWVNRKGKKTKCESCLKIIKKSEGVIGSPWGCFCSDCVGGLLRYVLGSEHE